MNRAPPPFPRAPLIGAAALIGLSLLAAVIGRLDGVVPDQPSAAPLASRDLRFEDRPDGAVAVYDAAGRQPIEVAVGQNGFLRGTLRGLARERRAESKGPETPFRLTAWTDGRLTLDDLATGRHIELEAFGPTNERVFAEFLAAREATR